MKFVRFSGYAEDVSDAGIFTYRLKGFDQQPTDHYMRTYYVDATPTFKDQKPFCYGSLPRHKVPFEAFLRVTIIPLGGVRAQKNIIDTAIDNNY